MARGGNLKIFNEPFYPIPYYAVGDLYLTTNPENPSTRLGYGTWSLFGPGRTIVCVDTFQSEFNTVKKTGGSKSVTLTINQMPSHKHPVVYDGNKKPVNLNAVGSANSYGITGWNGTALSSSAEVYGDNVGGGQAHNNLQPFITCYVWLRTA